MIDGTIKSLVDAYMAEQKQKVDLGKMKVGTYWEHEQKIADFVGYCTHHKKTRIDRLDSEFLEDYRLDSLNLITAGDQRAHSRQETL